jgi:IclR family acetate operon transcriptional repressor
MADATNRRTVNATRTSFAVIETLAEYGRSVGVTELAVELDLPKSTAYKHLKTLCELGYVRKDGTDYALGRGFGGICESARAADRLYITAKHHIDTLAEVTDEVAGLVIEQQGYAVDTYRSWPASGPHAYGTNSRYLHCSAPGKAILSALSDRRVEEIIEQTGLPTKTDHTLSSRSELRDELDRIAERGIAFERGEQKDELRSVAVPVTMNERVLGAVYVAGSADRMKSKRFGEDIPGIIISTVKQLVPEL